VLHITSSVSEEPLPQCHLWATCSEGQPETRFCGGQTVSSAQYSSTNVRNRSVSPPVPRLTSDNTSCLQWITQTHFKIKLQGVCWSLFSLSIRCRQVGSNSVHCNFHTDSEASYRTDSEGGWDVSQCYIWK